MHVYKNFHELLSYFLYLFHQLVLNYFVVQIRWLNETEYNVFCLKQYTKQQIINFNNLKVLLFLLVIKT